MKIGILTFHRAHNYGAVLQAYALRRYLTLKGYNVNIIDYRGEVNKRSRLSNFFKRRNLLVLFFSIVFKLSRVYRRYKKFDSFISDYLQPQDTVFSGEEFSDLNYDVYIVGSDQVWNRDIIGRNDLVFFGDLRQKKEFKLISYAASLGNQKISKEDGKQFKRLLQNFDQISVRERDGVDLISEMLEKPVAHVFDPTFLLSGKDYEEIIGTPVLQEDYVLVYQVVDHPATVGIAQSLAQQLNAKVIFLESSIKGFRPLKNHYETLGPGEYLSLIRGAKCIVTTSFHGTAFSIIYKRPFYVVNLDTHNSRPKSLLNSLHLQDRILYGEDVAFSEIDYNIVDVSLNKWITESGLFLENNL